MATRAKRTRSVPDATVRTQHAAKKPVEPASQHDGETLRFSFCETDTGGRWSLEKLKGPHVARLVRRLKSLESMTVDQMMSNHTISRIDMTSCPNDSAATRLANQYQGLDVLHEIRVAQSEQQRLFGRLDGRFFNIIWWDPSHEVWPESKNRR